jgi:hypothetical protein
MRRKGRVAGRFQGVERREYRRAGPTRRGRDFFVRTSSYPTPNTQSQCYWRPTPQPERERS